MKKLIYLWALAFFFVACGSAHTEGGDDNGSEADSTAMQQMDELEEDMTGEAEAAAEGEEMLAEHVCNENCSEAGCHFMHGEKGHVCGEECAAKMEEGEGHEGHDHEGHDHGEEG